MISSQEWTLETILSIVKRHENQKEVSEHSFTKSLIHKWHGTVLKLHIQKFDKFIYFLKFYNMQKKSYFWLWFPCSDKGAVNLQIYSNIIPTFSTIRH